MKYTYTENYDESANLSSGALKMWETLEITFKNGWNGHAKKKK